VIVLAERRGSAVAERRGSSAVAAVAERRASTVERRDSKAALQIRDVHPVSV
jgi:hypothetical protein